MWKAAGNGNMGALFVAPLRRRRSGERAKITLSAHTVSGC